MNEKSGKGTLAVLGIAGAFVLVCIVTIVLGAIGFYNGAVNLETGIKASYSDNQNVYDNYSKKVMEAAQIPEKYESALKEIYKVAIGARYGKQGSKAVFQWIQEHNPTVDSAVYTKVQDIIESGRNEFQANQTSLIQRKKDYQVYLITFPNNVYAGFMRFPKIDMNKYDIVTSDETSKAFETKKAAPLSVFK